MQSILQQREKSASELLPFQPTKDSIIILRRNGDRSCLKYEQLQECFENMRSPDLDVDKKIIRDMFFLGSPGVHVTSDRNSGLFKRASKEKSDATVVYIETEVENIQKAYSITCEDAFDVMKTLRTEKLCYINLNSANSNVISHSTISHLNREYQNISLIFVTDVTVVMLYEFRGCIFVMNMDITQLLGTIDKTAFFE